MMPKTTAECSIASHLEDAFGGLYSLVHTGACITTKACVNPRINLIKYSTYRFSLTAKCHQAAAFDITITTIIHFAGKILNKYDANMVEKLSPKYTIDPKYAICSCEMCSSSPIANKAAGITPVS